MSGAAAGSSPRPWLRRFVILDAASGQVVHELKGHSGCVWGVAFSRDGKRLTSASGDRHTGPGEVKIWDTVTGQELYTVRGHARAIHGVAFSPDGKRLATAGQNHRVKVHGPSP